MHEHISRDDRGQNDKLSWATSTTDPLGNTVSMVYDANGNLTSFTDPRGGITGFGYDAASRRTLATLPNLVSIDYGYDDANQLTSLTYKRLGATLRALAYGYDAAGRRSGARRHRFDPHVKQLGLIDRQTGLDVAQRLARGDLCERHHSKQVDAAQRAHACIAAVLLDDPAEGLPWHELHHLRESCSHQRVRTNFVAAARRAR